MNLNADLRTVVIILLIIIAGMLFAWRPWNSQTAGDRTIDVTGEAKLKAEPDEFAFYPSYQFKNDTKDAALAEATVKSNDIVAKLKGLGVADNKIKVDTSGFNIDYPVSREIKETPTYNLQITISVSSKDQAQKVQDYLTSTAPTGQVSPQGTFSDTKRKELEDKARDKATKNAREKAEKSAENLGFKIGKVKTVSDGVGFNNPMPMGREVMATDMRAGSTSSSLPVQPGENELSYTVSVTYYLK